MVTRPPQQHDARRCSAGVAPERQKIMVKGGLLRDDTEWAKAGIKPGQKLMMMGTADVVPTAPTGNQACRCRRLCHPPSETEPAGLYQQEQIWLSETRLL